MNNVVVPRQDRISIATDNPAELVLTQEGMTGEANDIIYVARENVPRLIAEIQD